jgi:hypothetical protein
MNQNSTLLEFLKSTEAQKAKGATPSSAPRPMLGGWEVQGEGADQLKGSDGPPISRRASMFDTSVSSRYGPAPSGPMGPARIEENPLYPSYPSSDKMISPPAGFGEESAKTAGGLLKNSAKKGFDYLFGAPTAEEAQNILKTQPTDPAQRARLQATATGNGEPSDLTKTGSYLFGRPDKPGDPNILGAQTAPDKIPNFGLANPESSTAIGEDPFSAPIAQPQPQPQAQANPNQQILLRDPASSTAGLSETQAYLQESFGAPTISAIQAAPEGLGMQTDPEGRMIDPSVDRSSYEQESAAREARIDAKADFGTAVSDRDRRAARGEGMSDADRRDIAKANARGANASDIARGQKVADALGVDRKTGKPLEGNGLTVEQQIAIRKQEFAESEAKRKAGIAEEGLATEATEGKNRDFAAAEAMFASNQNIAEVGQIAQRQAGQNLTTGIAGAILSKLKPGSNAANLQANLDTLTADAAFSSLQTMRDNSKTGGALGAISERELTLLGAAQRSLAASQSPEQLKTNIAAYLKLRSESIARVKVAFAKEYGQAEANRIFGGGSSNGSSGAIPNDRNVASNNEALYTKYSQ